MLIYTVALVQDEDTVKALYWSYNTNDAFRCTETGAYYGSKIDCNLANFGKDKVLFFLQTCDRSTMLSARIKCECAELRDIVRHHKAILSNRNEQAHALCAEIQEIHCRRIGKLVRRLLSREYREIKDELALQCFHLVQSEQRASDIRNRMDKEFNSVYYRNRMNTYC